LYCFNVIAARLKCVKKIIIVWMVTYDLYLCINSKNNSRRKSWSNSYRNGDNNQLWKYLKRRTKRYLWFFLDMVQIYSKNIWLEMIVKHKVVLNAIVLKHSGLKLDMWFYNGDINRDRYFMPHRLTFKKNTFPYLFTKNTTVDLKCIVHSAVKIFSKFGSN